MILGVLPSMYAASEFVVPRSIPMILGIRFTSIFHDDYLRGTQDAVVQTVSLPHDFVDHAVLGPGVGHLLDAVMHVRVERPAHGRDLLQPGLLKNLHEIVADQPDALARRSPEGCDRGVHLLKS